MAQKAFLMQRGIDVGIDVGTKNPALRRAGVHCWPGIGLGQESWGELGLGPESWGELGLAGANVMSHHNQCVRSPIAMRVELYA